MDKPDHHIPRKEKSIRDRGFWHDAAWAQVASATDLRNDLKVDEKDGGDDSLG